MILHQKNIFAGLALIILVVLTASCVQTDKLINSEDIQQSSPPITTQNTRESVVQELNTQATSEAAIETSVTTGKSGDYDASDTIELLAAAEELIDSAQTVGALRSALLSLDSVSKVSVYKSAEEVHNSTLQIFEGDAEKGMVVVLYYEGGSWAEITKQ
jgi:hypothetical protein